MPGAAIPVWARFWRLREKEEEDGTEEDGGGIYGRIYPAENSWRRDPARASTPLPTETSVGGRAHRSSVEKRWTYEQVY